MIRMAYCTSKLQANLGSCSRFRKSILGSSSAKSMITHLDIDGFKSFKDFSVDFAPFTVIAGANASGKTNLFDALAFLKGIAEYGDLEKAMAGSRGVPLHLFTQYGPEHYAKEMRFAVDLLVPKVSPSLNGLRTITHSTRLRYILVVGRNIHDKGRYGPYIKYESVETIDPSKDEWVKSFIPVGNTDAYLSAAHEPVVVYEYDDEQVEPSVGRFIPRVSKMGQATTESHSALLAVRVALQQLAFLNLDDKSLYANAHQPFSVSKDSTSNRLIDIVSKLKEEQPQGLGYLRGFVSSIVPEVSDIDIYKDELEQETLVVYDSARKMMTAGSLSAGTLRVILLSAYIVLNGDSSLLIEEPENGIAPGKIGSVVDLLNRMATDFDPVNPSLRQLICTTHSPNLLSYVREHGSKATTAYLTLKNSLITTIDDQRVKVGVTRLEHIPLVNESSVPQGRRTLAQARDYFTRSEASLDA